MRKKKKLNGFIKFLAISWSIVWTCFIIFVAYAILVLLIDMFFGASSLNNGHCIDFVLFKPAHFVLNKLLGNNYC